MPGGPGNLGPIVQSTFLEQSLVVSLMRCGSHADGSSIL